MSRWLRVFSTLSVPLLLGLGTGWAAGQPAAATAAFAPCSDCHDEVAARFANNPHAMSGKVKGKALCESCHGDSAKHLAQADKTTITVPSGGAGAKACLACHGGKTGFERAGSGFHASAAVNCTDCHSIHGAATAAPTLLRTAESTSLCVGCHPSQKAQFGKPYAHHLARGGVECVDCHNPHGGHGERSLKLTTAGQLPCLSCHPDTRGPFVFTHVSGFAGNCLTCHEPHGSNNPKMLTRARVDQVCLECHTLFPAGNLGPQPPAFHDLRSPRYTNCTVCHVAIHGSNSSPTLLK